MSNPIGAGTAQITYNAPTAESVLLNKVAFDANISRGQLAREIIAGKRKLEGWVLAFIETIRIEHDTMKHGISCLLLVGLLVQFFAGQSDPARRVCRRSRRDEAGMVEFLETEET